MTTIFWFSGTGNSLYVAKKLADILGDAKLVKMTKEYKQPLSGKLGFVFPSYYGNLPRLVRAFVERLTILPDAYIFAIVTGGGAMTGSIREIRSLLAQRSLTLSYGQGIFMKGNYVASYNPADPAKMDKTLAHADKRVAKIANDISAEVKAVRTLPITSNNLYNNIEALDAKFTANDACTGCALCERICPVSNIALKPDANGKNKPNWLHHCEHCMACISWCPVTAINYGDKTQTRRRYHNPRIKADELIE